MHSYCVADRLDFRHTVGEVEHLCLQMSAGGTSCHVWAYAKYFAKFSVDTHRAKLLRPLLILLHEKMEVSAFVTLPLELYLGKLLNKHPDAVLAEQHVDESFLVCLVQGDNVLDFSIDAVWWKIKNRTNNSQYVVSNYKNVCTHARTHVFICTHRIKRDIYITPHI